MSSDQQNNEELAKAVAAEIAKTANAAAREAISSVIAAGAEQLEKQRDNARRIDARLEERVNVHANVVDAAVAKLTSVEGQLGTAASALLSVLDNRINAYQEAAEAANAAELAAVKRLTDADAREAALVTRKEQAETAEAAAERRISEAVAKESRAEEAINVVRVRAELAVERAYAERDAKLKRKRTLAQLDQDEDNLINTFDLREEEIEKRFDVHYGDIKDEIQRIVSDETDAPDENHTGQGDSGEEVAANSSNAE